MRRPPSLLLPALLAMAACLGPSIPANYQCGPDGICPSGQTCEAISNLCRLPDQVRDTLPLGSGAAAADPGAPLSLVSTGATPTAQPGYQILAADGVLRITWVGYAEFSGSVFAAAGAIQKVSAGCSDNRCSAAAGINQVQASADGTRVDFVGFPPGTQRGGVELTLAPGAVLNLDLLVEGQRAADTVTFVSAEAASAGQTLSPAAVPFQVQIGAATPAGVLTTLSE